MRNYLTYGGHDSRDYGVYITGSGVFNAPAMSVEEIEIPGRHGLFLGEDRHLANVELTYPCFIYANYKENIQRFRNMLISQDSSSGYIRLTDSYHPDEYRMAVCQGPIEVEPTMKLDAGSFDLTFSCLPQRYLTSGESSVTVTSGAELVNPTDFTAKPLIIAYGTGRFRVGQGLVEIISAGSNATYLDSELMEAYYGGTSRNRNIRLINGYFPRLVPGSNSVELEGNITRLVITPRWWRI